MKTRMLALTAAGAATLTVLAAPATAGSSRKDLCKDGGYVYWTNVPGGAAFKNQGQCVAFASGGGTLVPAGGVL